MDLAIFKDHYSSEYTKLEGCHRQGVSVPFCPAILTPPLLVSLANMDCGVTDVLKRED